MDKRGSSLSSQIPAKSFYPKTDEYSPQLLTISLRTILILSPYLQLVLPSSLFLSGFKPPERP
jgi:hypothetical protein